MAAFGFIGMAAIGFIGMAAIAGWSLPEVASTGHRAERATPLTDSGVPDMTGEPPTSVHAKSSARHKLNCERCGVIESVRRIDTREEIVQGCAAGDTEGMRIPGYRIDGGDRNDLMWLAETVAGVIAGDHRAKNVRVTTRHQIVVRFRDGSRHVFNEDSQRTLREGDRIMVIAGSNRVNG